MKDIYAIYAVEEAEKLLEIDSPTGYTDAVAEYAKKRFEDLGYKAAYTNKGGGIVDLGGDENGEGLLIEAHLDTIGCMVRGIKPNGRLAVTNLGGLHANSVEGENVRIHTRGGKVIEGTFQLCNASVHVNDDFDGAKRNYQNMEVVIDEKVSDADDVRKLGIDNGDIVCFDPRTVLTKSGYIKSRFLDDKLLVGIMIAFARYLGENGVFLSRHTYLHLTVYEEVGHGGSASVPEGVTEGLSLDMGCVGDLLEADERKVSICAKDASGPYSYKMISKLIDAAKKSGADYAIDIYPHYGSDVEATLRGGSDLRHGLIGPGVYASHGYERSHIDGVLNTLKVIEAFINPEN